MGHWTELVIEAKTRVKDHVSLKDVVKSSIYTDECFYHESVVEEGAIRKYKIHVTFEDEGQRSIENVVAVNDGLRKVCLEHALVVNNLLIW